MLRMVTRESVVAATTPCKSPPTSGTSAASSAASVPEPMAISTSAWTSDRLHGVRHGHEARCFPVYGTSQNRSLLMCEALLAYEALSAEIMRFKSLWISSSSLDKSHARIE